VTDSNAKHLVDLARNEKDRLRRHLYLAAALREVLSDRPVVVGGTAEEYWTADEYNETDLDVCAVLRPRDESELLRLGLTKSGRHWELPGEHPVAVEFPEGRIDGDEERVVEETIGPGSFAVIGVDDLYLDRLRQTTATMQEDVHFHSALAVAAARLEDIDWDYVQSRIDAGDRMVREAMTKMNSRIRARVRRLVTDS
jgi:hypothetical protein